MTEITVWRYFATSITLPLVIPIVFLLISTWRFPPKRMNRIFLEIEGGMVGLGLLIYLLLGPTVISAWIAGTLLPVICTIAFLACCELRDGRLAFILVTAGLDTSICDALTTVFVQRDHFLWILLKVLITVLQTLLIWKFCRKPLLEMLDENQIKWGQVVWVPLFLWISLVAFCVYPAVAESRRAPVFPTLVLCITTVLLYVMLYRFQRAIRQQAEIQKYNAILRSEVGFLEKEAAQAEAASQSVRIFRHDMRHFIRLLRSCLASGNLGHAGEILDRLEENTAALGGLGVLHRYTGNPILDTVLTQAAARAEQAGIRFIVGLELPKFLQADVTELAVVISNALENALTAVDKETETKEPHVSLFGKPCGTQLLLEFSNSFSGPLRLDPATGLPSNQKEGHGYGTRSIFNFVQKYHGVLECTTQEEEFILKLLV